MNIEKLRQAAAQFKNDLERAITTATFNGKQCANGHEAKEALIRSSRLINLMHEVVKDSFAEELSRRRRTFSIHPPVGHSKPELKVTGFLKAKDQDVVVLLDGARPTREVVADGPLRGEKDDVGYAASERAIVVGVRSQMSSVNKNFDTLMERAFAETLNLRLRLKSVVMGEVYVLPAVEYDDKAMKSNRVQYRRAVDVPRFIRTFAGISGRGGATLAESLHKYDRSALVVIDFRASPPAVCLETADLVRAGVVSAAGALEFSSLSPAGFISDLIDRHDERFGGAGQER